MKYLKYVLIVVFFLSPLQKVFPFQLSSDDATIIKKERRIAIHTETAVWGIEFYDTKRINIQSPKGTALANITIPYRKGSIVEFISGRTIRPDLTEIILIPEENVEEKLLFPQHTSRDYIKDLIIHFPQVEPGTTIEYTVKRMSESIYFLEPFYFQDELYVDEAVLNFDLKIGFEYTYLSLNQGNREFSVDKAKWNLTAAVKDLKWDAERYQWTYNGLDPVRHEINMPPLKEMAFGCFFALTYYKYDPYDYSIHENWKDVDENIKKLYNDQMKDNNDAEKKAKEITNGIKEKEEKVKTIFSYIQSNIELLPVTGIHYSEFSPDDVLESKLGDNQETNLLFVAMLKEVGIKAYPALVATREYGLIYPQFCSPDQFNKVVTYIPDLNDGLWLDPSSKNSPYPILPPKCSGVSALPLGYKKGEILKTSVLGTRQNLVNNSAQVTIEPDGKIKGNAQSQFYAYNEYRFRKLLTGMSETERKSYIENMVKKSLPEASISELTITDPKDFTQQLQINYSFETANTMFNDNKEVEINPAIFSFFFHDFLKAEDRTYPFFLDFKKTEMVAINLYLPENSEVVSIPKSVVNKQYFGEFYRMVNPVGNSLSYQERLVLKQDKYETAEYTLLKKFSDQIVENKTEKIGIKVN